MIDQKNKSPEISLKSNWRQAVFALLLPILLVLAVRWIVLEPFVIPSESMVPNLLIHDHLAVTKFNFGLRIPFSKEYLIFWHKPQRGDVVVFRYPKDPEVYYIKRIVGLPGEKIKIENKNIFVNGFPINRLIKTTLTNEFNESINKQSAYFEYFKEELQDSTIDTEEFRNSNNNEEFHGKSDSTEEFHGKTNNNEEFQGKINNKEKFQSRTNNIEHLVENDSLRNYEKNIKHHLVRFHTQELNISEVADLFRDRFEIEIPEEAYFMMGDNRDESSDSRVWGVVDQNLLVGKASFIWLSCDEMMENADFICNPLKIRWQRMFKPVQ